MEDFQIVDLYWNRDERAIEETNNKYGRYCAKIAYNVLKNTEDTEECVNDTWLKTWNTIPDLRPDSLLVYVGRIIRNLSIDLYRKKHAAKRGNGEVEYIFDELTEVSHTETPEKKTIDKELSASINLFLEGLKKQERMIFVRRYFYMDSILDICEKFDMKEGSVKSILHRIRGKMKKHLEKEGLC